MKNIHWVGLIFAITTLSCKVSFDNVQEKDHRYVLTTEEQLENKLYAEEIEKFYESGKEGYFTGKANIEIYYKIFQQPEEGAAAILISSGRTEAAIKYKEFIFDLYNNGYAVYIHDHRGQGLSGRMTEDPDMGYIDTFQFYIDDMKYFYDHMLNQRAHKKKYLIAHSMGGAIGMTYLQQNPNDFDAAAFSSPMLGLSFPSCKATKILTQEEPKYALGQGKYIEGGEGFKNNQLTGSEMRYKRMIDAFDAEPKAHAKFIRKAQKLGKTCKAFLIEDARHELLIEKDKQRIQTISQIFDFFDAYG